MLACDKQVAYFLLLRKVKMAITGNGNREFMPESSTDTVLVILIEITICTEMTAHEYRHDFTFRKPSLTISTTFTIAIIGW